MAATRMAVRRCAVRCGFCVGGPHAGTGPERPPEQSGAAVSPGTSVDSLDPAKRPEVFYFGRDASR